LRLHDSVTKQVLSCPLLRYEAVILPYLDSLIAYQHHDLHLLLLATSMDPVETLEVLGCLTRKRLIDGVAFPVES
jgi:hypothetical protein